MRRLRHRFASVVSLVVLTFVTTNGLPRHASYVHQHAGDAHGHVHVGEQTRRSSLSVRDFARHDHAHPHDHDHQHDHARVHAARHTDHHHPQPREQRTVARQGATKATPGPAYASPGEPLHEHWQDPFQTAAITALRHVSPVALTVAPAGVAPVAAPVERARALRARGPPLSLA